MNAAALNAKSSAVLQFYAGAGHAASVMEIIARVRILLLPLLSLPAQ